MSRPFYIALYKHIEYTARKGCWNTAFEACKLVYSFAPEQDPLAMLHVIDYYALRAKQSEWLVQAWHEWKVEKQLSAYPNWMYSVSLAHLLCSNEVEV